MINTLSVYLPIDRRYALASGATLPERTNGSALFADISGSTPLMEAMTRALGPRRGAEEMSRQLNRVYDALIAAIDHLGGSVIGFAGDAITCWFADTADESSPPALRATACALACQDAMQQFASVKIPDGSTVTLAMKAAVASGPARRFLVGDPAIQLMDALTGETLMRMASAEHLADKGDVIIDTPTAEILGDRARIREWRSSEEPTARFAVIERLTVPVQPASWPPLTTQDLAEAQVRPWLLPPVYKRLREGLGEFLTELRPAVALFLRFEGIDYDHDPAAGSKLDAFIRWMQSTVTRLEGYVLQLIMGDKGSYLYAAFGAPTAHEDDARRAVSAALALRTLPESLDFIRPAQIGISQGTMRAGGYGGTTRRTYGVLGDEVNLAARLMQSAEPGQVLVSARVQRATADTFVWETLAPIQVKGKREPVPIARLVSQPQIQAAAWDIRPASRLIGRDTEMENLGAALAQVTMGKGQIARIEGGTGIGKTRLAAEFASQARQQGIQVCVGVCQSITQDIAYAPWQSVFGMLLELDGEPLAGGSAALPHIRQAAQVEAAVQRLNPDWQIRLPLLGDLMGLPIADNATTAAFDPRARQEALFAFAGELVLACAHRRPLLLFIDDAHWMDEASLGLTVALARVIAESPVLLMLVHRSLAHDERSILPDLNRLSGYSHLNLTELAPEAIAELVAQRLGMSSPQGGQVSSLVSTLLQARSQGNPFFAEALVDALRESGKLVCPRGRWVLSESLINTLREANCLISSIGVTEEEWSLGPEVERTTMPLGIPDSIHGAVLARLDRLPEQPKLTLKVASVIGRTFERDLLAHAHPSHPGPAALQSQLDLCEQRDLIQSETPVAQRAAYMFKHNITQEVACETLTEAQQRELHRAIGAAQEALEPEAVERLAYHFSRGGVRYKALFYLDKAARKAQRSYANETALNYFLQALALEEFWEWRKGQAEVLHILGRRQEEQDALNVLEASPDAPVYEVAYHWGQYYESIGDYTQAQAAAQRALAVSQERADRVRQANCLAQLGLIARRQGDYERAKMWYQQAMALFPQEMDSSPEEAAALAQALNGLGIVHRQQGDFDQAHQCYEQALALNHTTGNRLGEADVLNSLGAIAYFRRDLSMALMFYQQALELRRAIGDRAGEGISLYNLATAICDAGDYSKSREYLSAALAIHQSTGNRWEESNVWNYLGVLHQEVGDLAHAQTCLEMGLMLSREIGDEGGQAYLLSNLGLVMRDQGNLAAAEKLLSEGLARTQAQFDRYMASAFHSYLGTISLQAGQFEQAIERANLAFTMRRELALHLRVADDLSTIASAHLALGNNAKALDYAQQAIVILNECQGEGPESPQRDYFVCYQVLQTNGQTEAARDALQSARRLVMARADKIADPSLRQSFLERVPINREIIQTASRAADR